MSSSDDRRDGDGPAAKGAALTVLVADDSALYRQMLLNVLDRIPGVRVVAVARDGVETLEGAAAHDPDVITLDVEMPRLDGLGVLRELRRRGSRARVIMVSSLTAEGSPVTVDALMEGAFDFVAKPPALEMHRVRGHIHAALLEKLSAIVDSTRSSQSTDPAVDSTNVVVPVWRVERGIEVVAIGTSTGGPRALTAVLPALPGDLAAPVLVVQHMPAGFTASLATRLDTLSPLRVVEAAPGMVLAPGTAYVAPGGMHLRVERTARGPLCVVDSEPHRLGCRPSYDNLLESLPGAFGARALAVVLTGMGRDGVDGCQAIKQAGGHVLAQAAEGCTVFGMPKAVAEAGLADAVLPLGAVAGAITRVVQRRGGS